MSKEQPDEIGGEPRLPVEPPPDSEGRRMMYVNLKAVELPCIEGAPASEERAKEEREEGDGARGAGGKLP